MIKCECKQLDYTATLMLNNRLLYKPKNNVLYIPNFFDATDKIKININFTNLPNIPFFAKVYLYFLKDVGINLNVKNNTIYLGDTIIRDNKLIFDVENPELFYTKGVFCVGYIYINIIGVDEIMVAQIMPITLDKLEKMYCKCLCNF